MKKNFLELKVKGIALEKETNSPIAILQDDCEEYLVTLCIGPYEAGAIITELEGIFTPQPQTHDIFASFFIQHHFSMKHLEIYDITPDNAYRSRIIYKKGLLLYSMDVKPSDGIALAVRLKAPIFIRTDILDLHPDNFNASSQLPFQSTEILFLGMDSPIFRS